MLKLSKLSDKLSSASPVPEVQLEQYVPALERLTTLRVLQQVSQVYQTMKISNLTNMISFFDFSVVEKLAVDAVKYNFVQVKVDHLKGVVSFGSQVSILAAALSGILTEVFRLPDVPTEVLMRFMWLSLSSTFYLFR
jgi:hypothetical protein